MKQNEDLKHKIIDYRSKILSIKKDVSTLGKNKNKNKEPNSLQEIIINQS
jgi:hypothetical protein